MRRKEKGGREGKEKKRTSKRKEKEKKREKEKEGRKKKRRKEKEKDGRPRRQACFAWTLQGNSSPGFGRAAQSRVKGLPERRGVLVLLEGSEVK